MDYLTLSRGVGIRRTTKILVFLCVCLSIFCILISVTFTVSAQQMQGGEIKNFVWVWLTVIVALCYCYTISKRVPKGLSRLLTILPIVCIFLTLPLKLNSVHLGSITALFVAWLATFKVLLFAFGKGPLSSDPSMSLHHFVVAGSLPIKIQQHPSPNINKEEQTGNDPLFHRTEPKRETKTAAVGLKSILNYTIKLLLLAMLLRVYEYREHIHHNVILILYGCHIYFCLEILLAMIAASAHAVSGLELEPQFNEPYLSTSLQDFWGRRWNLMVTSILHQTVYHPVRYISTGLIGRQLAPFPAVLSTFLVSGIMHELIFYYISRRSPSWEVTWYFLLHGVCVSVEIAVKKIVNRRHMLDPLVSGLMTFGFLGFTGVWLFIPQILRREVDKKMFEEYAAIGVFVKDVFAAFRYRCFEFNINQRHVAVIQK